MEKPLNFVLKLSLKQMALRKVVSKLWSEKDILLSFNYLKSYNIYEKEFKIEWQDNVECRVKDKVSKLVLPETLKEKLMKLVRPIGLEILRWIKSFDALKLICFEECFDISILEQLSWTFAGAVDVKKTVENLVRYVTFNVDKRYELACKYCLVDLIQPIWEELSENAKETFYKENTVEETIMETYWTYFLKGEEFKLNSIYKAKFNRSFYWNAFENSIDDGNKAATKYFFQKLTPQERDSFLFEAVIDIITMRYNDLQYPNGEYSEVLCYLFSQMSNEQQVEVFKTHTWSTLRFFLVWPVQDLFLDIENNVRSFLSEGYYFGLYHIFADAIHWDYYFPDLMQKLFLRIPSDFKKLFAFRFGHLFFQFADTETIGVVLRNVDLDTRGQFVSSVCFSSLKNLMAEGKWHIAEACLQELSLSKEEKKCLKEAFFGHLNDITERTQKQKWERLLKFLDETDARRKTEDEMPPEVKKLCTEEKRNNLSSN